jgi:hypothetical protein
MSQQTKTKVFLAEVKQDDGTYDFYGVFGIERAFALSRELGGRAVQLTLLNPECRG